MRELTLTTREREAVLGVLCELDPTRHGLPSDLRNWKRKAVSQPLWVYRLREKGRHKAQVFRAVTRDVSAGGIGLYSKMPFEVGERFVLPVHFEEGGRLYLCEVASVRTGPGGGFRSVGARFLASVEQGQGTVPEIPEEWLGAVD